MLALCHITLVKVRIDWLLEMRELHSFWEGGSSPDFDSKEGGTLMENGKVREYSTERAQIFYLILRALRYFFTGVVDIWRAVAIWINSTKSNSKDGNGSGSDRVESPCTQNRNPKSKPESAPKTDSGGNPSPKPNPRIPETRTDTRNPNGYPKPADIYTHIHMYKQEATNNKYFHESTLNKFNNLSKQIIISIL